MGGGGEHGYFLELYNAKRLFFQFELPVCRHVFVIIMPTLANIFKVLEHALTS